VSGLIDSVAEFVEQPFGAVGAVAVMAAVTVMNSRRVRERTGARLVPLFNGLNLIGGTCLLINAFKRDEIVWIVLEIYFIAIALKGLAQSRVDEEVIHLTAGSSDWPTVTVRVR